jgi:hypothetical protein
MLSDQKVNKPLREDFSSTKGMFNEQQNKEIGAFLLISVGSNQIIHGDGVH